MKTLLRTTWACVGCVGSLLVPTGFIAAQEPEAAHVEMYYGVRRIDNGAAKESMAPAAVKAGPKSQEPDPGLAVQPPHLSADAVPPTPVGWRPEPQQVRAAHWQSAKEPVAPALHATIPAALSEVVVATADHAPPVPAMTEKALSTPASVQLPPIAVNVTAPRRDEGGDNNDGQQITFRSFAMLFLSAAAAAVLSPVLLACGLVLLKRRGGAPLFRIEYVSNQPFASGHSAAVEFAPAAATAPSESPPAHAETAPAYPGREEHMPEPFELGLTFQEEKAKHEERGRQQESAILQQLFEDNLRLREQIAELPPPDKSGGKR